MKITGKKVTGGGKAFTPKARGTAAVSSSFAELLVNSAGAAESSGGSGGEAQPQAHMSTDAMLDMRRALGELTTQSSAVPGMIEPLGNGAGLLPYSLLIKQADISRKLNVGSKGDRELTEEQIRTLNKKYDMKNLSPQAQYDLYRELTELGALTAGDVEAVGMSHIMLKGGFFARAAEFSFLKRAGGARGNLYEWMNAAVNDEQAQYDYMTRIGERLEQDGRYHDESMQNAYLLFKKNLPGVQKMMTQHKRAAEVFKVLTGKQENAPG